MTFDSLQKGCRNNRENYIIPHELDSSAIVRLSHAKMIWQSENKTRDPNHDKSEAFGGHIAQVQKQKKSQRS